MPIRAPDNMSPIGHSETLTTLPRTDRRSKRIPLPMNHPFQYWVDPVRLALRGGVATYAPVKIEVIPGVQNVPGNGDPATIESYQKRENGRVAVPMDFEVIAWGKKRAGYLVRMKTGTDLIGKELYHYHDVWTRYELIGNKVIATFDHDGWGDFEGRCGALMDVKPHPAIVSAERSRLEAAAQSHDRISHKSPGANHTAAQIRAKLQPEVASA